MLCPLCNRPMTALFISWVCDYCDGADLSGPFDRGYVVWRDRPPASEEYVFRTWEDAERWRRHMRLDGRPIKLVLTASAFRWRRSQGTLTDVVLADHRFQIYPDHRFAPGPHRAFLAPEMQVA